MVPKLGTKPTWFQIFYIQRLALYSFWPPFFWSFSSGHSAAWLPAHRRPCRGRSRPRCESIAPPRRSPWSAKGAGRGCSCCDQRPESRYILDQVFLSAWWSYKCLGLQQVYYNCLIVSQNLIMSWGPLLCWDWFLFLMELNKHDAKWHEKRKSEDSDQAVWESRNKLGHVSFLKIKQQQLFMVWLEQVQFWAAGINKRSWTIPAVHDLETQNHNSDDPSWSIGQCLHFLGWDLRLLVFHFLHFTRAICGFIHEPAAWSIEKGQGPSKQRFVVDIRCCFGSTPSVGQKKTNLWWWETNNWRNLSDLWVYSPTSSFPHRSQDKMKSWHQKHVKPSWYTRMLSHKNEKHDENI